MFCNRVVILPEFFIQLIFFLQFIHHVRNRVFGQMGGNRKNKLKSRSLHGSTDLILSEHM